MQKSQPRVLCAVLWLVIVAIVVASLVVPTYRMNETFVGEVVDRGEHYPATIELDIAYRRGPFFDEQTKGNVRLSYGDNKFKAHDRAFYFSPRSTYDPTWDPCFNDISIYWWDDSSSSRPIKDLHTFGFIDEARNTLLLHSGSEGFIFAGASWSVEDATAAFDHLNSMLGPLDGLGFTENPFSHEPLIDRETANATRTETPPDVLLKMAARDFLSDCWEYLLIGAVALVALILSHWFPQIYLNRWILDALHEGRSGAKKYLNHSRICFTAMGLAVPLFACLAYFVKFDMWQFSSGNIFFVAMIAAIIGLLVLLHRRAWIQIKEK